MITGLTERQDRHPSLLHTFMSEQMLLHQADCGEYNIVTVVGSTCHEVILRMPWFRVGGVRCQKTCGVLQ